MGRSLAILGVPGVMGEHKRTLIITDFTQSLGAELLTNGDFSAWTGDNPDGWIVAESPPTREVTEVGAGEGHGGAGTGLANFYNSDGGNVILYRTIFTVGYWYESGVLVDTIMNGRLDFYPAGNSGPSVPLSATALVRCIRKAQSTSIWIRSQRVNDDVTIDNTTVKRIALNTQQTMPAANALIEFLYTLPASPAAYDEISVCDRISDASLEAGYNCWRAYIQRNTANAAWDFRLDSVNAGTATNRINITGVGDTVGFRHRANGTLHDCWTTANGVDWTKRGSQVNVSWNDAATGVNTVYSSQATPTKLTVTPL